MIAHADVHKPAVCAVAHHKQARRVVVCGAVTVRVVVQPGGVVQGNGFAELSTKPQKA